MNDGIRRTTRRRLPGTPAPMWRCRTPDGLTLAVDEWGPRDAPAVVLLHGGGQTRHAWRGLGERVAAGGVPPLRALAVDLRGHGDSDWDAAGDYTYDAIAADLLALRDAAGAGDPIWVGASLGGAAALAGVGEGVLPARALVLVDTAPRLDPSGVAGLRGFMTARPDGYRDLDEVADAIAAFTGRPRPASTDGLRKNLRIDEAGRYHWHWDPAFMRGADAHAPAVRQARLERAARALGVPTMLVRGGRSELLSEQSAQEFLELCPHARYVNIAGARHMVAADRNDEFAEAVLTFCRELAATPTGAPSVRPADPTLRSITR